MSPEYPELEGSDKISLNSLNDASSGGYNTGDGIRMSAKVGAKLWHMDVYESISVVGSLMVEPGTNGLNAVMTAMKLLSGSSVALAQDGSRYVCEDTTARHGHAYNHGLWEIPHYSSYNYIVYDQAKADQVGDLGDFQAQVIKADTLDELAEKTGMDAEILKKTIANFNSYAEAGEDPEFGRDAATMTAFSAEGPYYAVATEPNILNTQGGPQKNENAEVLGYDGNPIPHLYCAGELGGICSLQYQGGGNIAECLIFGKIAGENAAKAKDNVRTTLTKAEANLVYTPGAVSDIGAETVIETAENEYVGTSENGMDGTLKVKVTMEDGKIAKVDVVEQKETVGIGDKAIEAIPAAIVAANSTEVDTVSGATVTSKAIIEAVNDALSQVK